MLAFVYRWQTGKHSQFRLMTKHPLMSNKDFTRFKAIHRIADFIVFFIFFLKRDERQLRQFLFFPLYYNIVHYNVCSIL